MEFLKFLQSQLAKKSVGTLTLGKRQSFREIFFQGESMYLVGDRFSGKVAVRRLRELGIPGQRLSVAQFEKVLQEMDRTRQMVATALHEKQLLSEEEHGEAALDNLAEEMIELLGASAGSFHFQEGRVPEYLLTSEGIAVRIAVPVERVLRELRRRTELRPSLESAIPSAEEVFVLSEKGLALRHAKQADFVTLKLLELLDGLRNFGTVLADSYFYRFEALAAAARALDDGLIKKTILPELRGLAVEGLSREDAERYLPYFKNAVKHGMDEIAARERLAVLHEKLGAADEAVIQYNFIGDVLYRMGRSARAIKAYQRALQLRPGEFLVAEKITRIYSAAADKDIAGGNKAQAIQFLDSALRLRPEDGEVFSKLLALLLEGKKLQELAAICDFLAVQARQSRRAELATQPLREILRHLPAHAVFRRKLINVYLDLGLLAEASQEMQCLAEQYLERGQAAKAQELLEKIRRLGKAPGASRHLARQATAALGSSRRRVSRAALLCVGLLLGYQVWSYTHWQALRQEPGVALAESLGGRQGESFAVTPEERAGAALARRYEAFIRDFPLSIFGREAIRRRGDLASRLEQVERARQEQAGRLLAAARTAAAEGRIAEARELLEPLVALHPLDARRAEAIRLLEESSRHEHSADDLLQQARSQLESGDARATYRTLRRLVEEFPASRHLADLRLPITVDSIPGGADVVLVEESGTRQPLGRTPVIVSLPPDGTAAIELARTGCRTRRAEIREEDGASSVQLLAGTPEWSLPLASKPVQAPAVAGGWAVLRTADGRITARELAGGAEAWSLQGDATVELIAPLLCLERRFFGAWNNGKAVFGKWPDAPAVARGPSTSDVFLGGLATSPCHAVAGGRLVALGVSPGKLHAYDAASGALAWSLSLDDAVEGLAALEADILAATASGQVARLRAQPAGIVWKRPASHGPLEAVAGGSGPALLLTRKKQIITLDAGTGAQVSFAALAPGAKACLSPGAHAVFVLSPEGMLSRFRPGETSPGRERQLEVRAEGLLPLAGRLGVRHSGQHGLLLVDDESLEPLWNVQLAQPILHAVLHGGTLVVVSADGRLSAYRACGP